MCGAIGKTDVLAVRNASSQQRRRRLCERKTKWFIDFVAQLYLFVLFCKRFFFSSLLHFEMNTSCSRDLFRCEWQLTRSYVNPKCRRARLEQKIRSSSRQQAAGTHGSFHLENIYENAIFSCSTMLAVRLWPLPLLLKNMTDLIPRRSKKKPVRKIGMHLAQAKRRSSQCITPGAEKKNVHISQTVVGA